MNREGMVMKVMTDEEWASLSEQSRQNLITLFGYNQFPKPGASNELIISIFDEREQAVLRGVMAEWDMPAHAAVRHYFRLGQMLALFMKKGQELGFLNDQGDFEPAIQHGPKLAPPPTSEDLDRWGDEGGATSLTDHIDCPCWITGTYKRVEGCKDHPYDL